MIAALLLAAVCAPLPTCTATLTTNCATPTPVVAWNQTLHTQTKAFRVKWRHPGEVAWLGSADLPLWPGDADSDPVWPGVSLGVPIQRYTPTEQLLELEVVVVAVLLDGTEVAPAPSATTIICQPRVWMGKPGVYN